MTMAVAATTGRESICTTCSMAPMPTVTGPMAMTRDTGAATVTSMAMTSAAVTMTRGTRATRMAIDRIKLVVRTRATRH